MPIEKQPETLAPRIPEDAGFCYRVGRKKGETWVTIAKSFNLDVWHLIKFNFQTEDPDVVNWYLREYVGCKDTTRDRKNWKFSARANPGVIYIPRTRVQTHVRNRNANRSVNHSVRSFASGRIELRHEVRTSRQANHSTSNHLLLATAPQEFQDMLTSSEKLLAHLKLLASILAASDTDMKSEMNGRMWRLKEYERMLIKENAKLEELADELEMIEAKLAPGALRSAHQSSRTSKLISAIAGSDSIRLFRCQVAYPFEDILSNARC